MTVMGRFKGCRKCDNLHIAAPGTWDTSSITSVAVELSGLLVSKNQEICSLCYSPTQVYPHVKFVAGSMPFYIPITLLVKSWKNKHTHTHTPILRWLHHANSQCLTRLTVKSAMLCCLPSGNLTVCTTKKTQLFNDRMRQVNPNHIDTL